MTNQSFYEWCNRHKCATCPLYDRNETDCRKVAEILDGCCGETMPMKGTIEVLIKALQVIDACGNGQTEANPYEHYCIDRAISALLDMTE